MNNANSWKFLRFLRLKEEAIKISFLENACKESLDMLECFKQWTMDPWKEIDSGIMQFAD